MKKRGIFNEFILLLSLVILAVSFASFVLAQSQPEGPETFTISDSGRRTTRTAAEIEAEAGNVTALVIDDQRITEAWQGYYGNITGTIVLDDAYNVTFYDWALPSPTGEIYASNGSSVTWTDIYCMNLSHLRGTVGTEIGEGAIVYNINMTQIERYFGINNSEFGGSEDLDGLNETFNGTYTDATGFRVGEVTIDANDGCSYADLYTDEGPDSNWKELLLTDNSSLIFTAIIRSDKDMYKSTGSETADFQMLVLENGHVGSEDSTTSYYFYVELA
jgi:hypothetical protein